MLADVASQGLLDSLVNLNNKHGYGCNQYFSWMVDDVLADLGIKKVDIPPVEVMPDLFELGMLYGKAVMACDPFTDILGFVYMELAGKFKQKSLGQFFTPWPIALMLSQMVYPQADSVNQDRLTSVCDPACGSGILLLAFAHHTLLSHGPESLRFFSFTGIDLDGLCARMTACQFLSNAFLHRLTLGELLVYRGNALSDATDWEVVVHSTRSDLPADWFIPANARSRLLAVRDAAKSAPMQSGFDF